MKNNKALIVSAVFLVIVLGFAYFGRSPDTKNGGVDEQNIVERVITRVMEQIKNLGAFPGPSISSSFLEVNGVTLYPYKMKMIQGNQAQTGTTTVCSFYGPPATTTIVMAGASTDTRAATTAGEFVIISKYPLNNATSSLVTGVAQNTVDSLTMSATSGLSFILPPSGILDFQFRYGAGGSHFTGTGTCSALLQGF